MPFEREVEHRECRRLRRPREPRRALHRNADRLEPHPGGEPTHEAVALVHPPHRLVGLTVEEPEVACVAGNAAVGEPTGDPVEGA